MAENWRQRSYSQGLLSALARAVASPISVLDYKGDAPADVKM